MTFWTSLSGRAQVSIMETLETLPWIFASARAMIGKVPYHIGPTSIPVL
jgi:hypothetical protein